MLPLKGCSLWKDEQDSTKLQREETKKSRKLKRYYQKNIKYKM